MRCSLVLLLYSLAGLAQSPDSTFDAVFQAQQEAWNAGRYNLAAAKRAELRKFIDSAPAQAPEFPAWVQRVAVSCYESAGFHGEARTLVEQALERAGTSAPAETRVELLNLLAIFWRNDRNPLKSAAYLERAAATAKDGGVSPMSAYAQLANLYYELGRKDLADVAIAELRAMGRQGEDALSFLLRNEGRQDEALAILKSRVDRPGGSPMESVSALQRISGILAGRHQYAEAASALNEALVRVENLHNVNFSHMIREQTAILLARSGQTEAADQVFQQLSAARADGDSLDSAQERANYYIQTDRKAQAEQLLLDFLQSHSDLPPQEEAQVLCVLGNAASDEEHAREYRRRAEEKQRAADLAAGEEESAASNYLRQAEAAVNGKPEEALRLARLAIDIARSEPAARVETIPAATQIASMLSEHDADDEAEELFQALLAITETWSADALQPYLDVAAEYAQFRTSLGDEPEEALDAIARYRSLLIAAWGEGTGWLMDVPRLEIQVERDRGAYARAVILAQDLVTLAESLGGRGSRDYTDAQKLLKECLAAKTEMQPEKGV